MTDVKPFDVTADEGFPVQLPSGATWYVLTQDESDYLVDRVHRYLTDNRFTNVSDVQDIDRMVMFELLVHRWTLWLSKGVDYYNDEVNSRELADRVNAYSTEIRQLKKGLGVDKVARDRARGDDSVVAYLEQLKVRAGEFGIMRNEQFSKVIELFHQLKALIIYNANTDELEKREQHITDEDLLDWIKNVAIPEFDAIDATFRDEKQKLWVRSQ